MTEKIILGEDARKEIKKGVDLVADTVKVSLGSKGKNVVIGGMNKSTKDGFSIARSIKYSDPILSIGSELIKEVSRLTVKVAGDGTTTATILAQAIIAEGFKMISSGHNGQELKRGIDKAVSIVVDSLKGMSQKVGIDSPKLKQIAIISGNNDELIGGTVFDAFGKTGIDGVITLDDSKTGSTYLDFKDGLTFNRGYISEYFINNQENLTCQLDEPLVLICQGKISHLKDIKKIMDTVVKEKRSIVMIAEDFDGEALYAILTSRVKGAFPICLIKSPSFGDAQKDMLKDIATVVGANVVSEESGLRLDTVKLEDFGTCDKVLVTKEETTIVGGGGKRYDIDERISYIRKCIQLIDPNDTWGRTNLEERLAKLTGGCAIIYVGAATETEQAELKDRYDDALRATRCAIEEGIVVGGGVALVRCTKIVDTFLRNNSTQMSEGEKAGIKLLLSVLEYPFNQMIKNADLEGKVAVWSLFAGNPPNGYGYNFKTDTFENLMETGVVDPLKVVRVALINAASFAGTLLTTEAIVVQEKENNNFVSPLNR